jgi:hypothetical protein
VAGLPPSGGATPDQPGRREVWRLAARVGRDGGARCHERGGGQDHSRAAGWRLAGLCQGNCNDAQVYLCVTPPLPLLSNSAENINSALTLHPLMKPIMDFKQWLDEHVDFFFELHEADAHPANSRLHAFWRETGSTANKPRLSTLVNCMNHQTNLALVSAVHLVQISVINSMYTAVRFLKMSGRSAFKC